MAQYRKDKFEVGQIVRWSWPQVPAEIDPEMDYEILKITDVRPNSYNTVFHTQFITIRNDLGKNETFTGAAWELVEEQIDA